MRFVNKVIPIISYQNFLAHPIFKKKNPSPISDPSVLQFHGLFVGPFWCRRFKFIMAFTCGFFKVWGAFSFFVKSGSHTGEAQIGRETLRGWA